MEKMSIFTFLGLMFTFLLTGIYISDRIKPDLDRVIKFLVQLLASIIGNTLNYIRSELIIDVANAILMIKYVIKHEQKYDERIISYDRKTREIIYKVSEQNGESDILVSNIKDKTEKASHAPIEATEIDVIIEKSRPSIELIGIKSRGYKKKALLITASIASLFLYFLGMGFLEGMEYRRHPSYKGVIELFSNEEPNKIVSRILILLPGIPAYNKNTRDWIYLHSKVSDNFYNSMLLEHNFFSMEEDQKLTYLESYPITPTKKFTTYLKQVIEDGNYDQAISFISKHNSPELKDQLGYAMVYSYKINPLPENFNTIFTWLLQNNIRLSVDFLTENKNIGDMDFYLGMVDLLDQDVVKSDKDLSIKLYAASESRIFGEDKKIKPESLELISLLLFNGSYSGNLKDSLITNLGNIDDKDIVRIFTHAGSNLSESDYELCDTIFLRLIDKPTPVIEALGTLAKANNIGLVEHFSEAILNKDITKIENSEVKKSIIVILINYNSDLGKGYLDHVFMGLAKPKNKIYLVNNYTTGSAASDKYISLASHDYTETGKTWPPSYIKFPPSFNETEQWRSFINEYPWFPATDDAYYRLAFSYFYFKQYQKSLDTILEFYNKSDFVDNDASPYVGYLLKFVLANINIPSQNELLKNIKIIYEQPVSGFIYSQHPDIKNLKRAINWFIENESKLVYLNTDIKTIGLMKRICDVISDYSDLSERIDIIAKILLQEYQDKSEDVDNIKTSANLSGVLYSRFFSPKAAKLSNLASIPGGELGELPNSFFIREMKLILKNVAPNEKLYLGTLNLLELHRDNNFGRLIDSSQELFDLIKEFVPSILDTNSIDNNTISGKPAEEVEINNIVNKVP
ncbi:tetratricopeptide repeat protein [Methylomonas sp. YC3]